jgi:hypothetical protein
MPSETDRRLDSTAAVVVAQIPAGQSIALFSAVGALLDAALGGAMLAPGNGRDVAAVAQLRAGQSEQDAVGRLRAAISVLTDEPLPVVVVPADPEPVLTVQQVSADPDDGGVTFSIGRPDEMAQDMAAALLEAFIPALEHHDAANYLEFPATDPATGQRYAVIVVKPNGLSPHQARQQAEAEADRLRAQLAELRQRAGLE